MIPYSYSNYHWARDSDPQKSLVGGYTDSLEPTIRVPSGFLQAFVGNL